MDVTTEDVLPFTPNNSASETVMELPLSSNVTERAVSFGASGNPKSGGGIPRQGTARKMVSSREYMVAGKMPGEREPWRRDAFLMSVQETALPLILRLSFQR